LAKTPRKWTGARTPSGLKRVRSAERRHAVLGPRRTAAKTLIRAALAAAANPENGDPATALAAAESALDRAAKSGAIHKNAAARRKSRLALTMNATIGGTVLATSHVAKTVGKAAAQKAAKARIAAGKAGKAKGAQTAAGKARAALTRSTRTEGAADTAAAAKVAAPAPAKAAPAKATKASKAAAPKAKAAKVAKPAAKKAAKA
jgi:ribosomal protein S20